MSFFELALIGLALAMDAFAVSIAEGIRMKHLQYLYAFRLSLLFAVFQAVMPLIGYLVGKTVYDYIAQIDHWVAMGLLAFIGIKMILEANRRGTAESQSAELPNIKTLLVLGLATSIDALAVGISFAIQQVSIVQSIIIIGAITFIVCFIGVLLGRKLGALIQKKAEIIGGLVLIGIGLKIFIEHVS